MEPRAVNRPGWVSAVYLDCADAVPDLVLLHQSGICFPLKVLLFLNKQISLPQKNSQTILLKTGRKKKKKREKRKEIKQLLIIKSCLLVVFL